MLVKISWIHGVPSVQLCNGAEMDKPVHLYGLPISTWGMCRNPSADFRYFFQFLFAFRIGFSSSHLFGQFSMAFGKNDSGITGDGHGGQFFLFVGCFWIIHKIQIFQLMCNTFFQIQHAMLINLSVQRSMAGGSLFHEFSEHSYFVSFFPFFGNVIEDAFALGAPFPIRNYLALIGVYIFLADGVTLQFAGVQYMKVFHAVTGQFRESRYGFGAWSTFTYNQFVFTYVYSFPFTDFKEVQCS